MANKNLSKSALQTAISQIGKCEQPLGSNWGTPVKDYLKSVGINFPASWCMAFVYWCFEQNSNKDNPLVKTGGVLHAWNTEEKIHRVVEPQAGDIFIMDFGKGLGHTGIVESVDGKYVHTIEGNSNSDGSRNGVKVVRHIRLISSFKGFLRY